PDIFPEASSAVAALLKSLASSMAARKLRTAEAVAPPVEEAKPSLGGAKAQVSDEVVCSVFAPPEVVTGRLIQIQAFLHLKERRLEVARDATSRDPSANRRGSATLTTPIVRGSIVDLYLDCPALSIAAPAFRQIEWKGENADPAIFYASVPGQPAGSTIS